MSEVPVTILTFLLSCTALFKVHTRGIEFTASAAFPILLFIENIIVFVLFKTSIRVREIKLAVDVFRALVYVSLR